MKHLKKYKLFENTETFKSEISELFTNYVVDECSFTLEQGFEYDAKHICYGIDTGTDVLETKRVGYVEIAIVGGHNAEWKELSKLITILLDKTTEMGFKSKMSVFVAHRGWNVDHVELSTIDDYIGNNSRTYVGLPLLIKIYETSKEI